MLTSDTGVSLKWCYQHRHFGTSMPSGGVHPIRTQGIHMIQKLIGDPRFFARSGPHSLATVAETAGAAAPSIDLLLTGVAPLQTAEPDEVSFLDNRRYAPALEKTLAGAVIIHPDMRSRVPAGTVPIVTAEPYAGWARVAALFHPTPPGCPGVHLSAFVAEDARVDPSAEVGPFALVEAGAEVCAGCRIGPYAAVGSRRTRFRMSDRRARQP